jgi:hypothetical protein
VRPRPLPQVGSLAPAASPTRATPFR